MVVNASNPWTDEKLLACLPHLVTVQCRLQKLNGGAFDTSDTTAMAQGETQISFDGPVPVDRVIVANCFIQIFWSFSGLTGWTAPPTGIFSYSRNGKFTFLDNLAQQGFGTTTHRGYVGLKAPYDWRINGMWGKYSLQPFFPAGMAGGSINKTFTRTDGETAWLLAEDTNYTTNKTAPFGSPPGNPPNTGYDEMGFRTYAAEVLSTFSPPPMADAATLVMDLDRDGVVGTNDLDRVDESHPFRFWVNADGNNAAYPEADLEDFFPAQIKWAEGGGAANLTFKLSSNVGLDYIATTMTTNDADAYLTDLTVAETLSGGSIPFLSAGTQTGTAFAENTILLLAATEADTSAEIYVHILENGSEILVSTNYFSFSPVADMYRTKNLRAGGSSSTGEPANWPDDLTNGKDLVYVHGFNVDEDAARLWHENIFKRLWFAGSNAKYHGVIWDGIGNGSILTHFHNSVVNAFATAPWVATYLDSLQSTETVVLGHSLGNMVVSAAICEHDATVSQYYALDTAVALEAYGDVTANAAFVPDVVFTWEKEGFLNYKRRGWLDYPHETWAAEWYRLFPAGDPRSKLTFRHKFADIQEKTDVFNFYSSTEDILRVRNDVNNILQSITDIDIELFMHIVPVGLDISSQCAWQLQEMYKGMNNWAVEYGGGGSSPYTGWSFTEFDGRHQIDKKVKQPGGPPPTYTYTKYSESPHEARTALDTAPGNASIRAEYLANLQTDPLFNRMPWQLFEAGAFNFAGGLVGSYEDVLDYDNGEVSGGPDIDVSAVKVSDWLLAKGFPSRTGPMGSMVVGDIGGGWDDTSNFDMHNLYMTDSSEWIFKKPSSNQENEWRHSSWKDAPYVHVYKLFEKITTKEN